MSETLLSIYNLCGRTVPHQLITPGNPFYFPALMHHPLGIGNQIDIITRLGNKPQPTPAASRALAMLRDGTLRWDKNGCITFKR